MPTPPLQYNQYYLHAQHQMPPPPYPTQMPPQSLDPSLHPQMQSPQSQMQLDPALQLYYPGYHPYQQQPSQHPQQAQVPPTPTPQHTLHAQLSLPSHSPESTSSAQGSEYMGTPPADSATAQSRQSNSNGKRPSSTTNDSPSGSRKKTKTDDKDEEDELSPITEPPEGKIKATRGSRACTVCRRLKMKCVGAEQGPPCKRCLAGNHQCIFEESNRGKRSSKESSSSLKKHEQLTRSLRKMEKTLDTVLRSIGNPSLASIASGMVSRSPSPSGKTVKTQALMQTPSPPPSTTTVFSASQRRSGSPRLHSLPDNELNPLGLLAEASLANRRAQNRSLPQVHPSVVDLSDGKQKLGVANDVYFKPGPMTILPLRRLYIERQVQPEMLSFVTTEEVVALFKIYFENMNRHCSLLDPDFHTPSLVCSRSPFLLTTICAISSKFYNTRQELHPKLTNLARKLAFNVPERGYKSVEIVQAYLLLSLWGSGPVERYEQDKTWMLLGMAIRMATDLNLHRKTATTGQDTPEGRARDKEVHNRERTWLICYILDRSMSAQMGKPHSIKEDFIIQNTDQFWTKSIALRGDGGIAAYAELQRILSRSLDLLYSSTTTASGLQTDCDYYLITRTIETQLRQWHVEWNEKIIRTSESLAIHYIYWESMGAFYYNYAMLVIHSFGLQNALERSSVDVGHFFTRCHSSAVACVTIVRDELGPRGFLRYSPDSHFVLCSYAVLSLLKFTRPAFRPFLENEKKTLALVKDVADLLESIAAGPLHTPALYSTFIRALISVQTEGMSGQNSPKLSHTPRKIDQHGGNILNGEQPQNGNGDIHANLNLLNTGLDGAATPAEFHFNSEMGPVADISTFPPTMAPISPPDDTSGMLSMDSILSNGFWDSVLVPGYSNSLEGLSGGFVFGAGGSGLITPRLGTPLPSGSNTPTTSRQPDSFSENVNPGFASRSEGGTKPTS